MASIIGREAGRSDVVMTFSAVAIADSAPFQSAASICAALRWKGSVTHRGFSGRTSSKKR
jgi:hypothetical protein